jgi:hypothetical protein
MVTESHLQAEKAGSTVFRFAGFGDLPGAELWLPLLPIRVSSQGAPAPFVVNAVLDSGSTRTVLPFEIAEKLALQNLAFNDTMATAGGEAKVAQATIRLDIVDSNFPAVQYWSFEVLPVEVTEPSVDLALPLIGWDILHRFDTCLHPHEGFLLMRPSSAKH